MANITIVDGHLNKNVIKDKAPSVYMTEFSKSNNDLAATMSTHLIDVNADGIYTDDYGKFFTNRIKRIKQELSKRLIIKPTVDIV